MLLYTPSLEANLGYGMINEWKKLVNATRSSILESTGRLLYVFAFVYLLALSAKRHFHLRWKRFAHTDHETLHRNLQTRS